MLWRLQRQAASLLAWVVAAAPNKPPMALLPRDFGRQELQMQQMQTISGEVQHVLHDAHGVSIAMVPRLPSSVGEVLEWLRGQLLHLGDSDRCAPVLCMRSRTWLLDVLVSRCEAGGERWWVVVEWFVFPSVQSRWVRLARTVLSPPLCTMCGVWGIGVRDHRPPCAWCRRFFILPGQSAPPPPSRLFSIFSFDLLSPISFCLVSVSCLRLLSPILFTALPAPLAPACLIAARVPYPAARASSPLAHGALSSPYARDYREPHHLVGP